MSILLELELSLAQLLLPTYFKSILDMGIKLPGFFFPSNQIARLFSQLYWELNCQAYFFPELILDLYKCQHSSSLVSSIKKRILVFLKEFHCCRRGSNLRFSGYWTDTLAYWANWAWLTTNGYLVIYIENAAIALRLPCAHQGYNSIGWLLRTFFLENSRP